jgi:hypothetical protein
MLTISKPRISLFPEFDHLTPDLFELYEGQLFDFPPHCDFALNNLLVWFGADKTRISSLKGNIVLEVNDTVYSNQLGGSWYTILGDKMMDETFESFFKEELSEELIMVPDFTIAGLRDARAWTIKEDPDNRDYILSIPSLLNKTGKVYENFRYQISYFLKNHSEDAKLQDMDLMQPSVQEEIINGLQAWKVNSFTKGGNDYKRVDEQAIRKLLELQPILQTKHRCIGLYIDDTLSGFTIFHVPINSHRIGLGNHIKFDGKYKRMFDFLVFVTASRLRTEGLEFLNAEQDMGLPGIRHHKKYLNPVSYYRKYTVRKK